MRGDFDPYEAWLDIPSDRRPPTYYDLLAVPEDETDPQRIESAAAARMEFSITNRKLAGAFPAGRSRGETET